MGKLSREMIVTRVKTADLSKVRELNICGRYLTDVSILEDMPALEVLVLSVNEISTLKDFANCYNLRTLFLRKNLIADIKELNHLKSLRNLLNISFEDNPIVTKYGRNYRSLVLRVLPNLEALDCCEVTEEERRAALNMHEAPPAQLEKEQNFDNCDKKNTTPVKVDAVKAAMQHDVPIIDELKHKIKSEYLNIASATFCLLREMDIDTLHAVDDVVKNLVDQRMSEQQCKAKLR